MTSHHRIKEFYFKPGESGQPDGMILPPGWKPFAAYSQGGGLFVVCRKWVRQQDTVTSNR